MSPYSLWKKNSKLFSKTVRQRDRQTYTHTHVHTCILCIIWPLSITMSLNLHHVPRITPDFKIHQKIPDTISFSFTIFSSISSFLVLLSAWNSCPQISNLHFDLYVTHHYSIFLQCSVLLQSTYNLTLGFTLRCSFKWSMSSNRALWFYPLFLRRYFIDWRQ